MASKTQPVAGAIRPEHEVVPKDAPGIDGSALDDLLGLVERQRRIEEFRTRAESRRDKVTATVYDRVIADYDARLEQLRVEAAPLKRRVSAEHRKLQGVADHLRQRMEVAKLEKEELEFRRDLGELDDAEFARRVEAPSAILKQCQSELDGLEAQAARFLAALGPDDPTSDLPDPEPAAVQPRVASVDDGDETKLSSPEGFSLPSFPVSAPPQSSSGPDSGATVKLPEGSLVLEEEGGPTEFRLAASNHIGRTMDNQVQLVCAGVSRRHALIALGTNRQYVITDLQSQNGTFVNGEKVTEARLSDGDRIKIGEAVLTFHAPAQNRCHSPKGLGSSCYSSPMMVFTRHTAAAAVVAVCALAYPTHAQQKQGVFPFPYEIVTLENGFRAYLIKAGAPGQIAYVSVVRTGSRDEVEPGKSGFAHFFEHMMFRGTEKYPNYDAVTNKMGAFRNASTWPDQTAYYMVANSEYLEQIMDLESDRFMNLKYAEPDFKTEAGAILGEYQQGAREPQRFLNEKVREAAFDKHTYRHTTIGYEADVRAMPQAYRVQQVLLRALLPPGEHRPGHRRGFRYREDQSTDSQVLRRLEAGLQDAANRGGTGAERAA